MRRVLFYVVIVFIFIVSNVCADRDSDVEMLFAGSGPDIRQEGEPWVKGDIEDLWFPGGEGSTWTYEIPSIGEKIISVKTIQRINGREYSVIKEDGPMISILYGNCFGGDIYFPSGKFNPLLTFRTVVDQDGTKFLYGYAKDYTDFLVERAKDIEGVKKIEVTKGQEEWLLGYSYLPCKECRYMRGPEASVFSFWAYYTDGTKKLFEVSSSERVDSIVVPGGENHFVRYDFEFGQKTGDVLQDILSQTSIWSFYLDDDGGIIGVECNSPSLGAYLSRKLINYSLTPEKNPDIGIDIPSGRVATTWGNIKK